MLLAHRKRALKSLLFVHISGNLILVGTARGFHVYRIESTGMSTKILSRGDEESFFEDRLVVENSRKDQLSPSLGIGCVDVLQGSGLIALLGRSLHSSSVVLWDDVQQKAVAQLDFSTPVRSIRLCQDRLIVCFVTKIFVYQLFPLEKLYEFDMYWNEHSIVGLSQLDGKHRVLAFPARQKGQVQVAEINSIWSQNPEIPFTSRIVGHSTTLSAITVSHDGMYVATASQNGTLIRVWHSQTGALKHELRRGADAADIYSLAFDEKNTLLCAISDKNTLHMYHLALQASKSHSNRSSILSPFPYLPKYFSSDWSASSASIPDLTRAMIQFMPKSEVSAPQQILLVCSDGTYSIFEYDPIQGGDVLRKTYCTFYVA
jgi:WD40 repeat protein